MKIDPTVVSATLHSLAPPHSSTGKTGKADRSGSEVQSSAQLQRFSTAQVGSDFDAERVATIRAAISSGSYPIDSGRIADGLLRTVGDLLK